MLAIEKTNATTSPAIPDTQRPAPKLLDRMRDAIRGGRESRNRNGLR